MCQCGCGEVLIDQAFKLRDGTVIGYDEYRGCQYCWPGIGITLYFYKNDRSEWLEGAKIEKAPKPDEDGGNGGAGLSFEIISVDDLRAAAREMEERNQDFEHFASLDEWLEEHGLDLLQTALMKRNEKQREMEKKRNGQ